MHLQTVMQKKGIFQKHAYPIKTQSPDTSSHHLFNDKEYGFPIDELKRRHVINDQQYQAGLYYRFLFDGTYGKSRSSWLFETLNRSKGYRHFYNRFSGCEQVYEKVSRQLFQMSKKGASLVHRVVLYDQAIETKDIQTLKDSLDSLASFFCEKGDHFE